jgi:hypothetical protein
MNTGFRESTVVASGIFPAALTVQLYIYYISSMSPKPGGAELLVRRQWVRGIFACLFGASVNAEAGPSAKNPPIGTHWEHIRRMPRCERSKRLFLANEETAAIRDRVRRVQMKYEDL